MPIPTGIRFLADECEISHQKAPSAKAGGAFLVGFENPTLCVGFWKAFSYTKKSSFGKMKMATNHFILKGGYPEWI
ncbi:hypothetical protein, partial [Acidaminococcus sp.]|uniref:hypothetical protein n=1 Tax=Acidaminococcus sp. TaxID=1872103 RepID=UPI003D7F0012